MTSGIHSGRMTKQGMVEEILIADEGGPGVGAAPHILTLFAALLPILIGTLVLLGWASDHPLLRGSGPAWRGMHPLAAVTMLFAGTALAAVLRRSRPLALFAIGAAVVPPVNALLPAASRLAFEQLLFPGLVAGYARLNPAGMVPASAVEFLLACVALFLTIGARGPRAVRAAHFAATLGMVVALLAGIAYVFGAPSLSPHGSSAAVAPPTALGLFALFFGILTVRPELGWVSLFFRHGDLGATTARRLIAFVLGLPIVAGMTVNALLGWGPEVMPGFRMALAMAVIMIGLCVAVFRLCRRLSIADRERRASEAALRTSESRLRAIVDTAVDAMLVVDEEGCILHFNPAAQMIFGYGADEVLGQPVFVLLAGDHPPQFDDFLAATGRRGMDGRREIEGRRRDAVHVPLDLSIAEWRDGDRRLFTWIMRDLTLRYETTQALNAHMEKLERAESMMDLALAASGVALFSLDADGRYVWARNNRVGVADSDVVGAQPMELWDASCVAGLDAFYRRALAEGRALNAEFELNRRGGDSPRWVSIHARQVEGLDGRPGLACAAIDITAQKRGMAKLARSEARYRTIFSQAAVGLEQVGLDGRLLAVNDRMCGILGYRRDELLRKTFEDITDPAFHDEERKLLADLTAGRINEYCIEKQYLRQDGSPLWVRVSSSIPREEGVMYRISIVEDISAQKQAMEHLAAAREEAEQANRAKSKFLAAASHDLRQPTQAMMLLISALDGMLGKHRARPVVDSMQASLAALQSLLDALLDVSRLDAGVVVPSVRPVTAAKLLEGLEAQYALKAKEKGLALRFRGIPAVLSTDPALLERILRNLIENAIRYTDAGGVLVGCRRRAGKVVIQVVDTGVGIAEEDAQAIWEEFFQVGNPERDRAHGLGLGLAIVRRTVELLGLRLGMKSRLGRGTCFSLEIPLAADQSLAAAPGAGGAMAPSAQGGVPTGGIPGGGVILVIDDEPMIRTGLRMVLERWGCAVKAVASGDEAVHWVRSEGGRPDRIIADYRLAEGKLGTNAAREVQMACGRKLPTVIMTGDTAPERIAEATRSGFQIVHKPVAPDRLRELMRATPEVA